MIPPSDEFGAAPTPEARASQHTGRRGFSDWSGRRADQNHVYSRTSFRPMFGTTQAIAWLYCRNSNPTRLSGFPVESPAQTAGSIIHKRMAATVRSGSSQCRHGPHGHVEPLYTRRVPVLVEPRCSSKAEATAWRSFWIDASRNGPKQRSEY